MTLRVEPRAVHEFAQQLKEMKSHAEECKAYFDDHVFTWQPTDAQALLNPVFYAHRDIREQIAGILAHLVTLFGDSATELEAAANLYWNTDREAAARLDATYPVSE